MDGCCFPRADLEKPQRCRVWLGPAGISACCSATVLRLWFLTSEPCARCLGSFPGLRRSISAESPDYSRLKSRSGAIRDGTNPFQLQRGTKENVRGLELSFKTDFPSPCAWRVAGLGKGLVGAAGPSGLGLAALRHLPTALLAPALVGKAAIATPESFAWQLRAAQRQ